MATIGPEFYSAVQAQGAAKYLTVPDPDIIGDGTYFVVEADRRLIGCGGWSRRRKLFTGNTDQETLSSDWLDVDKDPAKVRAMFVDPQHVRKGIGETIFRACEEAAFRAGFRSIELMATLPGVPLYLRMGCVEVATEDVLLPNGSYLPCIKMAKVFGPCD